MGSFLSYLRAIFVLDADAILELRNDRRMSLPSVILFITSVIIHAVVVAFTNSLDYYLPHSLLDPRFSSFDFSYPSSFSLELFWAALSFDVVLVFILLITGAFLISVLGNTPFLKGLNELLNVLGFVMLLIITGSMLMVVTFFLGYNPPILARVFQILMVVMVIVYLQALMLTIDTSIPPWKILSVLWILVVIVIIIFGIQIR